MKKTSKETKSMTMAPGVIDHVIAIAASEVEGVASVSSYVTGGIIHQIISRAKNEPIETKLGEDGKLEAKVHLSCVYGYSIPEVAERVKQNVADALLLQTGIEVGKVDVCVESVEFKQD
jgi:uncharacterized alkaline shock family protein YloU